MKRFPNSFKLVLAGQVTSLFGNAVLRFVMPLHLLRQTGSAATFGLSSAAALIPMILCTLVGGVLADRLRKDRIMAALDLFTAVLSAGAALALGHLPPVPLTIAVMALLYAVQGLYQPSVQASVPALLEEEQLPRGNAWISMVDTVDELIGPAIGGVLYSLWGAVPVLAISAVCFVVSGIMELFLHIPQGPLPTRGGPLRTLLTDLEESARYLRSDPALIRLAVILALFNLVLSSAWAIGVPVLVVQHLGGSDTALGLTQSLMGVGGLVGGSLAGRSPAGIELRRSRRTLLVCSGTVFAVGLAVLPGVPADIGYGLVTLLAAVTMAAASLFNVQIFTELQTRIPSRLLGKVMAGFTALAVAAQPVGQGVYGVLYEWAAPSPLLFGAAVASLLVVRMAERAFSALGQGLQS